MYGVGILFIESCRNLLQEVHGLESVGRARRGCEAQCHGLVRLKAGNARIAGLCAVALCLTAFLAIGGPQIGASGTLCEPQNATTCSRGCPRRGADARGTPCAVASGSQEALVARRCSSA